MERDRVMREVRDIGERLERSEILERERYWIETES